MNIKFYLKIRLDNNTLMCKFIKIYYNFNNYYLIKLIKYLKYARLNSE
jgi:hypothetical protein